MKHYYTLKSEGTMVNRTKYKTLELAKSAQTKAQKKLRQIVIIVENWDF